jgi:hypothetical protein
VKKGIYFASGCWQCETAMHLAASEGFSELCVLLYEHDPGLLHLRDSWNCTPIMRSIDQVLSSFFLPLSSFLSSKLLVVRMCRLSFILLCCFVYYVYQSRMYQRTMLHIIHCAILPVPHRCIHDACMHACKARTFAPEGSEMGATLFQMCCRAHI